MLGKFCNLCQVARATGSYNLRTFSRSLVLRESHADTVPAWTFHEEEEEEEEERRDEKPKEPEESSVENRGPPLITCKRKEFNFYKGTVFKKFDAIPIASGSWNHYKSKGDYFTIHPDLSENDCARPMQNISFNELGLSNTVQNVVRKLGIREPTDIQKKGIPEILAGQNTVIQAETGTGKTFTYLLPMIDQILRWKPLLNRQPNSPLALILVPSRELVLQVTAEAKKLCEGLDIVVKSLVSGRTQKIMQNPSVMDIDILIGTVGIISKLTTIRVYKLKEVRHTVLDEVHALFDESYDEKLSIFLKRINFGFKHSTDTPNIPKYSQLTMASATMPNELPSYISTFVNVNSLVPIKTENINKILVPQKFYRLGADEKPAMLLKLIKPRALRKEGTIIFSNSTNTADWVSIFLNQMNIKAVALNGNHPFEIRREKYWDFRVGKAHILSATNSSARGLDTITVDYIINYDFPMNTADYIHRCGRTGRIGSRNPGKVINFICRPLEIELTRKIERAARKDKVLPIFDIYEQSKEKEFTTELDQLLKLGAEEQ